MRKVVLVLMAGLGLVMTNDVAQADFGACSGGHSPKWAFWARSNKCGYYASQDEERWQKFWHDYYKALHCFYKKLDKCDWVIYYKYHGYNLNGHGGQCYQPPPPVYAPVTVTPMLQWASQGGGAPCYAPNGGCGHGHGHGIFGGGYGAGIYGSGTPGWCRHCNK